MSLTSNDYNDPVALTTELLGRLSRSFLPRPPRALAVAVSGGGDSVALLHLLAKLCGAHQTKLHVLTVDHGLRPQSAGEAETVGQIAASLSVPHTILSWSDWDGTGNLQDQARRARYDLMTNWACQNGFSMLALGHTADDQAETVLMRLARCGGVDGLAAMPARRTQNGVTLVRPMLELSRAELRLFLNSHDLTWIDDPSNEDPRFDRVKMRKAMDTLAPLGITGAVLAQVAEQMGRAREALDWYSFLAAREMSRIDNGCIVVDLKKFRTLPDEIARRLLVRAVMWVSGSEYAPRRKPVSDMMMAVREGRALTLEGCIVSHHKGSLWVCREYNAVRSLSSPLDQPWDRRWIVQTPGDWDSGKFAQEGVIVRALGQRGLAQCPDWKDFGRPRAGLLSSPAIWRGDALLSAPHAGRPEGWNVALSHGGEEFFATLLSH